MTHEAPRLKSDATIAPDLVPLASEPGVSRQVQLIHKREKVAQFLGMFSSNRRRAGLTSDETLVFLAIGYLSASASKNHLMMKPVSYSEVAALLAMPKETARRKSIRLLDLDYVENTPKGIIVKRLDAWCQMFERAFADTEVLPR